ncbi:RAF proto-oncogene serine/threonine-protein kinase-like [Actinia tenebrosa]|uniref:RAF proto-oncogene serine/threonine-protein kinase-like n=1 Tax=Actinia tenebrosa TaxID=6105 RepID=A0A6P8HLM4_ACTTE|nr:RAF proto-oncogene serine/threonine-protein kinase-like [Actinia tenebrosa]
MDEITKTQKRYSRKHTKEERKAEKRRYKERQKLLKKATKPAKINQGVQTEAVQTSTFTARGHHMVNLAKQATIRKNDQVPSTAQSNNISSITRINRDDLTTQKQEDIIGSGSYGTCYKAYYRGNIPVVIKEFKPLLSKAEVIREATAILNIQKIEHHPCLPLLLGINLNKSPPLLVTQFHGAENDTSHTLSKAIRSKLLKSNEQWLDILIQLVKAVGFIHTRGWIHNDLKENNIVLHKITEMEWRPIVIDFGKSVKVLEAKCCKPKEKNYYWIAPEVLEGRSPPLQLSDIFSLGFIIKFVFRKLFTHKLADFVFESCLIKAPHLRMTSAQKLAATLISYKKASK